jgi:hypothetical protein
MRSVYRNGIRRVLLARDIVGACPHAGGGSVRVLPYHLADLYMRGTLTEFLARRSRRRWHGARAAWWRSRSPGVSPRGA